MKEKFIEASFHFCFVFWVGVDGMKESRSITSLKVHNKLVQRAIQIRIFVILVVGVHDGGANAMADVSH